jgi:hypothetical protein
MITTPIREAVIHDDGDDCAAGLGHAPGQAVGPFGIILLYMTGLAERIG